MPFDPGLKREASQKLEQYEGRVNHLYLDSKGKVTVGVGCLIANRAAMSLLTMYKAGPNGVQQTATLQDKQFEYDYIAKLAKGQYAVWYKPYAKLTMKNCDIDALRDRKLNSFYLELTNIYAKSRGCFESFDHFPRQVKMALLDMIFNLGATRLLHIFVKMNASVRVGDWERAAQQCHRASIGAERNQYVRRLFLSAANEENPA